MSNRTLVLSALALLMAAGLAAWALRTAPGASDPPAPQVSEPPSPPRRAATHNPALFPIPPRAAGESASPLYRPPHRTDKASVVGEVEPVDTRGLTPEEIAKRAAVAPEQPHPIAIEAGEGEKARRRAESQARREARARGEDPGPRDRSDSGPGQRVGETQDVLDEELEEQ